MIHGEAAVTIEDDQTDRIGIRTLILAQIWKPSRWPLSIEELSDEAPQVPAVPGGLALIGQQMRRVPGALRTLWTFEGINGNGKSVTFKDRTNSPDYAFQPGFAEMSILRNPKILDLLEQFNGSPLDGEIVWLPTLSGGTTGAGLSGGRATSSSKPNPMYGHTTYLAMQGTYIYRYAARDLRGLEAGVNKIHTGGLPGRAPTYSNRNWLKAPQVWEHRGTIFDITEPYWLSEEGGWNEPLYGKASANNTGGGLTTGSVSSGSL